MSFLRGIMRNVAGIGVTLFFAVLIFLIVSFLIRNPGFVDRLLSAIGEMIRQVFSVAGQG